MDQEEYRQAKETGELVSDADLQNEEIVEQEVEATVEVIENEDREPFEEVTSEEDNEPELTPKEKTAFEKRMERENKKIREQLEEQYKQKYSKHDEVIASMGGDPDRILNAAKEAQMLREANRLAEQNGWDEDQTQWYVNQRKQEQELKVLRVQMQINNLKDNVDYAGIASMEKEILAKIDKSNGSLSVDEAYWALGGHKKAEQLKLDAQMREIEKRKQTPRTVLTDSTTTHTQEKPLPDDVARDARKMGVSEATARKMMNGEIPNTIDDYRRMKAK